MLDRLTIERLEAAAGAGPILIALSGGGDSTALLHLLAERLGPSRLRAIIVDHALRAGAAGDACRAQAFAQALGVAAEIITLTWPNGPKRAQQDARAARYRALCTVARRFGASVIAVGHTRDDQAETVFLRAARGSHWRGLAGMRAFAPPPVWPEGRGLVLARPLLQCRRVALRELLAARGAEWIEDPANSNLIFARVRVRQRLAEMECAGLAPMRFAALAECLAPFAIAVEDAASALIRGAVTFEAGAARLTLALWCGPDPVRQRALSVVLAAAGGQEREAPAEQIAALEAQLTTASFKGATLAGVWLKPSGGHVWLRRDGGALLGRADGTPAAAALPLDQGGECVWDRRLALRARAPGWALVADISGPVLVRGAQRVPLAGAQDIADTNWLLAAHVDHLLANQR
jgi:tRNA(Ile)-lysidine synthase